MLIGLDGYYTLSLLSAQSMGKHSRHQSIHIRLTNNIRYFKIHQSMAHQSISILDVQIDIIVNKTTE